VIGGLRSGCVVGGLRVAVCHSGGHRAVCAAGNSVVVDRHVDGDLVVRLGNPGEMGDRGMGWDRLRGVGGGTSHCWGWWGL
jgi:hypothetical protein